MRHAKRMLLIPEDVYQQTLQPNDGSAIGHVRSQMRQIQNNTTAGDDIKAAKFNQEFKRMNKLARDEEERPIDVRMKNIQEIAEAIPQPPPVEGPKIVVLGSKKRKTRQPKKKRVIVEDEVWEDADDSGEPMPKLHPNAPTIVEQKTLTKQQVSEHVQKHAKALGVTPEGHVLRADGVTPYKTSRIEEIVEYLLNREKRSQFRNPPGYKEFLARAQNDPFLQQNLQQFGQGSVKVHKKPNVFAFKPTLW